MISIISNSLLGFSGACFTYSLRVIFALQCLCRGVSNNWLVETLKNKLFSEQSMKLSLFSISHANLVWVSLCYIVFGKLLTVFSLSVKYGASQLKKSYFLSTVSACFASRLPDPDLVAFLHIASFLLNLFFKLSNCRLASPRLREKMCALLRYTMYSEPSSINQDICFLIL